MRSKRFVLFIAICVLAAYGCVQQKDRRVNVQGAVSRLGGSALYVTYMDAQFKHTIDTVHSSMAG
ncbi:MAG: hypothetical protein NTY32_05850, partial [Bacteroidia bacterium]|nr:hypothetical protein [Bacteroidia bacterium]